MSKTVAKEKPGKLPHFWHLAEDESGVALTDLEYALMRSYESFVRWQAECLAAVSGEVLAGPDNALLHIICMHGRAKTIRDLLHLTNRQDTPNMQYGLRKLLKLGYISKSGSGRAGVYYSGTARGKGICRDYAKLRKKLLLRAFCAAPDHRNAARQAKEQLESIERAYETAAREAATFYRR